MEQPSTSRQASVRDNYFTNRINLMLQYADLSDLSMPVDDSDTDPKYILWEEEVPYEQLVVPSDGDEN